MRKLIATLTATTPVIGFTALIGSGSAASGATAQATTYNACNEPLNADRRTVYKLTNGSSTLSYGQMVVTATKEYYHRYCVQMQTGGRTVTGSYGNAEYRRTNGVCGEQLGALGTGTIQTGAFNRTMTVQNGTCETMSFSIRHDGRWYGATAMRYND